MQDETRRAELDSFHTVLTDISHGATTDDVRDFIIDAYVRGYQIATAAHVPFEGSTAVFTRRRYRDKWNRTVVRRVSKKHNHSTVEGQNTSTTSMKGRRGGYPDTGKKKGFCAFSLLLDP